MTAPRDTPGQIYERSFPVRLHHVDAAGIVFFANYFVLAHNVYESFMEDIGCSISKAIDGGQFIIPIAHAEAQYHRPMRHGETITGRLRLTSLRHSSYVLVSELYGPDGVLRAVVTTRHVCVNAETMRPTALPEPVKAALSPYLAA